MAIVDDYPAIAAELRRIQAEKMQGTKTSDVQHALAPRGHPMRLTTAGEVLYRRLVARR